MEPTNTPLKLLLDNFDLVLVHADAIRSDPRWFFSEVGKFSLAFVGGGGGLTIGMLLDLWQADAMRALATCGHCAYVVDLGGSPLSGDFSARGLCLECREVVSGRRGPAWPGLRFGTLWPAVVAERQRNPNRLEVVPGERPRFDWGSGVVGERSPDRVLRAPVDALPFAVLVAALRGDSPGGTPGATKGQ